MSLFSNDEMKEDIRNLRQQISILNAEVAELKRAAVVRVRRLSHTADPCGAYGYIQVPLAEAMAKVMGHCGVQFEYDAGRPGDVIVTKREKKKRR